MKTPEATLPASLNNAQQSTPDHYEGGRKGQYWRYRVILIPHHVLSLLLNKGSSLLIQTSIYIPLSHLTSKGREGA